MDNNKEKNNNLLENLFAKAKEVSLLSLEKAKMLQNIELFMANSVFQKEPLKAGVATSSLSDHFSKFFGFSFFRQYKFVPAFIIVLVLSFGTSFAARSSLPGDKLYPVKVNVNEKLESLLSIGAKAKVKTEVLQAEERLQEVEKLSVEGKLTTTTVATARENFNVKAEKVNNEITKFKAEGDLESADEISSDFESSLKNHHSLLVALSEKENGNEGGFLSDLAGNVDIHFRGAVLDRISLEDKIIASSTTSMNIKISAKGASKTAQNKINQTEKFINRVSVSIDSSLKAEALARLALAKNNQALGQAKLDQGLYREAFILFKKAERNAKDAKLMLDSENEIKPVVPGFLKWRFEYDEDNSAITASSTNSLGTSTLKRLDKSDQYKKSKEKEGEHNLENRNKVEIKVDTDDVIINGDKTIRD